MTKKDEKKQNDNILEEVLKKVQQKKTNQEEVSKHQKKDEINKNIALLEKEKKDALDIAAKVQHDYINLKVDFDRLQRMSLEKEKSMERTSLIKNMKTLFPVIEQLKVSLDHIDKSKEEDNFVKGVKMVYDNILKTLSSLGVHPIKSLGLVPDGLLHEPLSTLPVENEKEKGKIIQVFQEGCYLENNGEKIVIIPSKVIVGA